MRCILHFIFKLNLIFTLLPSTQQEGGRVYKPLSRCLSAPDSRAWGPSLTLATSYLEMEAAAGYLFKTFELDK